MPNKDENESEKVPEPFEPIPEIEITMTCGEDGTNLSPLWDRLDKALEPFGNSKEQFAILIRAAYSHIDPFMDGRLTDEDLVTLANVNKGDNNAYTDLKEMFEAFERALNK